MATCTMIAAIITCVMTGPRPTAAESAALLAPRQYVHVPRTYNPIGPTVTIVQSDPTHGPYGPLTIAAPITRLDGSSYFDPPWMHVGYINRYRWDQRSAGPTRHQRRSW